MSTTRETLERIDPETLRAGEVTGDATLILHLERYHFAATHLIGGRILDLACGVGYGTAVLAGTPNMTSVVGVDIAPEAIATARARYAVSGVSFVLADGMSFGAPASFDAVISLETIEHVESPERFLKHLTSLVRPGGILIGSVPVTPSIDGNPHHRTDFSVRSFRALGRRLGLCEIDALTQYQPFGARDVLSANTSRVVRNGRDLIGWYFRNPTSLGRRILSTVQHGFTNIYRTQVWQVPANRPASTGA